MFSRKTFFICLGILFSAYMLASCLPPDPCEGIDCGANGTCIEGICECNPGYEGEFCEVLSDTDLDGIPDDGDSSGTPGDNPCASEETLNCDDNCPEESNPNQEDYDNDGVGDVCDSCQGCDDLEDTDSDGVPDGCDQCEGYADEADADEDYIPDGCDQCTGDDASGDSNADGICDNPYTGAGYSCSTFLPLEPNGYCRWDCDTTASEAMTPGTCFGHGLPGCCYTCYTDCELIPAPPD